MSYATIHWRLYNIVRRVIAVMTLVYLTSHDYITLLFTDPLGHLMLAASAIWMTIGVLVMKKMINFDF